MTRSSTQAARKESIAFSFDEFELSDMLSKASVNFCKLKGYAPDEMQLRGVCKLCVATRGRHCAVSDSFFSSLVHEVLNLDNPKQVARWKGKVEDARGTARNVIFKDEMFFMRYEGGEMIPLVPIAVVRHVTSDRGGLKKLNDWYNQPSSREMRKIMNRPGTLRLPPTVVDSVHRSLDRNGGPSHLHAMM